MALTDEAILKIKGMLLSGELAPGDRLPPELELSERLGLSRSSLREAVKALSLIRVLDVRRGDGTYVTSLEPELLLEAMSFVVDLHDDDSILNILAVRRILEPAAAAMATPNLAPDNLALLRRMVAEVAEAGTVEELVEHDVAFHRIIVEAAGNPYLASLLENLTPHTIRARIWRGMTDEHAVARTLTEHTGVVDALESGDAPLVHALLTVHVSGVEQWLRRAL